MTDTPPVEPVGNRDDATGEPEPGSGTELDAAPVRPARAHRAVGIALTVLTVVALVGAAVLWWQAGRADDAAATARRGRNRAVAARRAVDRHTETVSHAADEPIGAADQVIVSVTKILGASGLVIGRANDTDGAFARAVDLANAGNLSGARNLYGGEVADDVKGLQQVLDDARRTLTSAQQSVLVLGSQAR